MRGEKARGPSRTQNSKTPGILSEQSGQVRVALLVYSTVHCWQRYEVVSEKFESLLCGVTNALCHPREWAASQQADCKYR
eukprot:jgi/Chrzof1/10856/Cz05g14200.t1